MQHQRKEDYLEGCGKYEQEIERKERKTTFVRRSEKKKRMAKRLVLRGKEENINCQKAGARALVRGFSRTPRLSQISPHPMQRTLILSQDGKRATTPAVQGSRQRCPFW
ncbi:hypothetical protein TWF192_011534 [Orbilia oligospora]|uniref:Uncharacterized protein n=1 Tax=Orbilia oligospora TaxID=2813651 RepID=A0A6G1LUF1_ORBOL|nr:hypothetical protein TWF191_011429 [Orbilia oligospora]KAF3233915.1 hypothetical protein TWF192_011534 [Orbilia oligospora]